MSIFRRKPRPTYSDQEILEVLAGVRPYQPITEFEYLRALARAILALQKKSQ